VLEVAKQGYPPVDTMLTADPPEQKRFRKLVNKAFSAKRVDSLEARVEGIANELVDRFEAKGRAELLSEFAQPLPLTVIAEQLGAPREDLARFRRWTDGFLAQLSGVASLAGQVEAARLIVEFQHYFAAKLEERRKEPHDDIISDIVHAQVEGERPLDLPEMLSILQQLLVAGNETTASAIVEGLWLLIRHPEQLQRVRREPALLPNLVEEVLRLATPTANMWRISTQESEVAGVRIPAGALCMVRFAAANRDPAKFPEPDRFDVGRANAGEHLAFGLGIHHCLGAALARKELVVAFGTLLGRLDGFALDAGAPVPRHRPSILLWGFDSLPITFRRRLS
jgi:cytochrome P450